jgi:hypothetical protein
LISESQKKAKYFANKHGYKLRKIKEGKVKIVRPNGSEIIVHDFSSAKLQMMSEVFGDQSDKNIFE